MSREIFVSVFDFGSWGGEWFLVEQNFETVKCGNDQTFDDVLVDTGSAILWVGGENPYVQGPNTKVYVFQLSHSMFFFFLPNSYYSTTRFRINSTFGVGYGIGSAQGIAYRDTVIIGDATGIDQFIGAANKTTGFNLVKPIDGIRTSVPFFDFFFKNNKIFKYEFMYSS